MHLSIPADTVIDTLSDLLDIDLRSERVVSVTFHVQGIEIRRYSVNSDGSRFLVGHGPEMAAATETLWIETTQPKRRATYIKDDDGATAPVATIA